MEDGVVGWVVSHQGKNNKHFQMKCIFMSGKFSDVVKYDPLTGKNYEHIFRTFRN